MSMNLGSYDLTRLLRPISRFAERRLPRLFTAVRRVGYELRLLLGGKLIFFALLDGLLMLGAFFQVVEDGAGIDPVYGRVTVLPALLIGVPALSSVLSLERRSGSIDLALAVPSTPRFFLARAASVLGVLAVQAVLALTLAWIEEHGGFVQALGDSGGYLRALVQTTLVLCLLPAVVLFWSVRARSAGAVMVGSAATLLLLMRWIVRRPDQVLSSPFAPVDRFLGIPVWHFVWLLDVTVLLVAVLVFGLYARERLRRPESLL